MVGVAGAQEAPSPSLSSSDVVLNVGTVLVGLVSAFLAGGIVGVAGLSMFIGRVRNDALLKDSIEKLAISLPPDTLYQVRQFVQVWREAGSLLDEVTDGKPNKTPAAPIDWTKQYDVPVS